jgi:hypothetical protein
MEVTSARGSNKLGMLFTRFGAGHGVILKILIWMSCKILPPCLGDFAAFTGTSVWISTRYGSSIGYPHNPYS